MLRHISRSLSFKSQLTKRCYSITRQCLATQQTVQRVTSNNNRMLEIKWDNGNADKYPYLYLRENCRCNQCYNEANKARQMFVPMSIDLNIGAKAMNLNGGGELNVEWEDGHTSTYTPKLLQELRYQPPGKGLPTGILKPGTQVWGSELKEEGKLPIFDFEKVLEDEDELYKWLITITNKTGIAKFVNVPKTPGQLEKLGNKVGYLASTFYGHSEYEIRAYAGDRSKDIGYSTAALPVHTDYSFCSTAPAVAMLHCIRQTETIGGENILVDAFHAAQLVHEENPEGSQLLADVAIKFNNITQTKIGFYHSIVYRNILRLDRDGKLKAVAYSDEFRDAHMPHPPEVMDEFYRAYFRFSELLHDKRTSFRMKMASGEMLCLNNHRVMHGRNSYEDVGENYRRLQLGYLDWDCLHAKLRVMAEERGEEWHSE